VSVIITRLKESKRGLNKTRARGMSITRQAMQVKATETAKSLGITNFKAGRGWCDRFIRREGLSLASNIHLSKYPSLFSRETAKHPALRY
jgi:hypothetical protein